MHARVRQLRVRPGKIPELKSALQSLMRPAREQTGFLGVLALGSGTTNPQEATLVALWDSLEAMRTSEENLLVMQSISRFTGCREAMPQIQEREVLASEFSSGTRRAAWPARVI